MVGVAGAILPPVSFTGVAIVAAVAFLVPLLLGLVPQLRLPFLAFLVILAAAVGFSMTRAARIAVLSADLRRLEATTAQIRVRGAFMLVAAMGALAIRLGVEGILGTFMAGAILRLSKGGAAMTTPEMRAKLQARLLKPLVVGATVLSVLNLASLSPAPRVHAALPPLPAADPCAAPLPASRVLPVASGIQTYTELIGGGLTFHLNQFGPQGLNAAVRRLGITPPAGDAVATWSLALPGGTRTYSGLTHVFARGAQEHICVQGIAYLNLGNGSSAATAPSVSVHLDGIFTSPTAPLITATSGRVNIRIGNASYYIFGKALATTSTSVGVPSTSCDTSQLTITPSGSSAGVGHVSIQFHVRNPSPQDCTLTGYPTVILLDAGRRPLPTFLHDGSGYLSGNRPVRTVRLGPGGDAYFVVEWVHIPSNGQACPTAPTLLIVPPAASTNTALVSVRGGVDACGGRLTVSPVEPTPFNF